MRKQELDERIDAGKKPVFAYIRLVDCPDFFGKVDESPWVYQYIVSWPKVVIGAYRGVALILEVKRI